MLPVEHIRFQASIGLVVLEQDGDKIDSIFLSVGGGGFAASVAYSIGILRPDIEGLSFF